MAEKVYGAQIQNEKTSRLDLMELASHYTWHRAASGKRIPASVGVAELAAECHKPSLCGFLFLKVVEQDSFVLSYRMSAGVKKNRGGLMEMYQASLERRIQEGDWNLVCRDEDLSKEVEGLLSKGAAQDTHSPLGLDPLSVMETSLESLPSTSGQTGLEKLAKAFEVLELAALNLYLCPWRKEYRVVKMFSGMFTHWVKPGLTLHQIKELFGLLGYQHMGIGEEEELRLSSKPVHADSLLQLACAFFTARIECRLLLSCISPLGSSLEWELQLIRERKRGHSLQIARDNAKRKIESTPQSSEHEMTVDLDLYTDDHLEPGEQAETNHMTAPPNLTYTPPKESQSSHGTSHSNTTSSKRENDDSTRSAVP
ncbi:hypothetical protein MHYP_G00124000 [Metynnis hypsauchen]